MVIAGWMNVVDGEMLQGLERAGYARKWEDSGFLYERGFPSQGISSV